jgi:hypothetical protein
MFEIIELSAFNDHLIGFLKRDFAGSTQGITDRIYSISFLFNNVKDLLQ